MLKDSCSLAAFCFYLHKTSKISFFLSQREMEGNDGKPYCCLPINNIYPALKADKMWTRLTKSIISVMYDRSRKKEQLKDGSF